MSQHEGVSPSLTLDDLYELRDLLKDDLQRQANQGIRKKDWSQGIGALASMEAIDNFIYTCELRARMYAPRVETTPRRKTGASVTSLPQPTPVVRKREKLSPASADDMPGWAREKLGGQK